MENYCNAKLINYEVVRFHSTLDPRIGISHTFVPGSDGKRGYGGTCFPKDTNALYFDMKKHKVPSYILKGSIYRNKRLDRKEQDGEKGRAYV
jgi:UDPglucose 6-dehydrogenase